MSKSYLETIALALIKSEKLPEPIREFKFCPAKKWRTDFAWPDQKILLEIEGGIWMKKGGHTTGRGYQNNCEKYNTAALMGFMVLRVTKLHLENGKMIEWLKSAFMVKCFT